MEVPLNLYSKPRSLCAFATRSILFFFICLIGRSALAININALYLSACKRELGVITGVDNYNVQLLLLSGKVIKVPRYEIIYLAYYPTDVLPIRQLKADSDLKIVTVKTLHENKIVDMIRGWPIDFSETKISFLTPNGGEAVIDRDNLWGVDIGSTPSEMTFQHIISSKYEFTHPYAFDYCPVALEGNLNSKEKALRVYPQQILSDPVMIKKELDRLKKGHEGIVEYHREQQFYAVPQLYHNIRPCPSFS
jgi:ADP-ribose pyrophosphatase YjhB (NUDIX family)